MRRWLDGVASDSSRVLWRSTRATGNPQRFGLGPQLGIRPVFDQPTRRSLEFNATLAFSSGFRNGVIALYCLVPGVQDSRCNIIGDTVSGLGNCVAAAAKSALAKADGRMGRVGWAAAGGSGAGTVQAWAGLGRAGRGPRRGRRRGPGAQWRGGAARGFPTVTPIRWPQTDRGRILLQVKIGTVTIIDISQPFKLTGSKT